MRIIVTDWMIIKYVDDQHQLDNHDEMLEAGTSVALASVVAAT